MKFYNEEVKERFIATRAVGMHNSYSRLFTNSMPVERGEEQDLFKLDLDSIAQVLNEMLSPTLVGARSNIYLVRSYIDWAVAEGLAETNTLDIIDSTWAEQFVKKNIKLFVTVEELVNIENGCANAQDAIVFRLLFEGVNGAQLSEITNLTKHDVDWGRKELRLTDNKKRVRFIKVSDRCLDMITEALEQEVYWSNNGQQDQYVTLVKSEYVVRPTTRTANPAPNAGVWVLTKRVRDIADYFGLTDVTPKGVQRSGMLYQAKLLLDEGATPTYDDYKKIAARYKAKIKSIYYDFLNTETVKELYDK